MKEFLRVQLQRWREYGSAWIVRRLFLKVLRLSIGLLLQPFALIAHRIGLRKVSIGERHIGHLVSEPDCLLKMVKLNLLPKKHYVLSVSPEEVVNPCLLEYWRQHFPVVTNGFLRYLLWAASEYGLIKLDVGEFVATERGSAFYYEVLARWGNRPPLLTLSSSHRERGRDALGRLGVPNGAWFVCLHVREGGYAPEFEEIQRYRNADIEHYRLAIQTIAAMGGWVIRMGDPSMKPLAGLPRCIDYAHSKEKSDWMDVFLSAECKFFLGNTSGLFFLSTAFGVPCALANLTPFAAKAFGPNDIYIPKLLKDKKTGRYLSFSEILQAPVANFRYAKLFSDAGIDMEENSPEDIDALVREALLGCAPVSGDEERVSRLNQLFQPGHYGYPSSSRMGSSFLAKYQNLL